MNIIPMPLLSNRFRLRFNNYLQFTQQLKECNINCKDKTINIQIIQPLNDNIIYDIINELCINHHIIILDHMDGKSDDPTTSIQFNNCICINHSLPLKYSDNNVCIHYLTLQYDNMVY